MSPPRAQFAVVITTLLLACAVTAAAAGAQTQGRTVMSAADAVEAPTLGKINDLRRSLGLRELEVSRALTRAAEFHSGSMGRSGYFSHTSSDGTAFSNRIARFYTPRGYRRWTVGEDLLWSSPDVSPDEAIKMWLGSPEHRQVLLNPRWREVGISAVHVRDATGAFGGRDVTIVTADFGARS